MKCFVIISLVLVNGMLCDISAQNVTSSTEEPSESNNGTDIRLKLIKLKCEENGEPDAFTAAYDARQNFRDCCYVHFNFSRFSDEYESAKTERRDEIGEVFKKYCGMISGAKKCLAEHDAALMPCLDEEERQHQLITQNIIKGLMDSVCANEASSLIQMEEIGGADCIENNGAELERCFDFNLKAIEQNNVLLRWPSLFAIDKCVAFSEMQSCVQTGVQICGDSILSGLLDSLFDAVKRVLSCGH